MNLDEYPTPCGREEGHRQEPRRRARGHREGSSGPIEAMYAIADHTRTLLFAIADGLAAEQRGRGLQPARPLQEGPVVHRLPRVEGRPRGGGELAHRPPRQDVSRARGAPRRRREGARGGDLPLRGHRCSASRGRSPRSPRSKKELGMDDLVRLYESEGITPEQLVDGGVKVAVPEDFYQRVVAKHVSQKLEQKNARVRHVRPPRDPRCSTTRTARSSSSRRRS